MESGIKGHDEELKSLETEIEVLERWQPVLLKTSNFVYSCSERADSDVKHITSEKIKGNKGCTISEESYQMDNDLKHVQRDTVINGTKYSFMKTIIGDEEYYSKGHERNPYAFIKEGFENGERTYYESWANGGPREVIHKELAYDSITYAPEKGIPFKTKKRNPAKDATFKEVYDYENGTTITIDRPIVDKNGNIIGKYNFSEQQNTHKFGKEYFRKNIVIESKCIDKDGKEIIYKSIIFDNGEGIMRRDDLVNGKKVADMLINQQAGFVTVRNYKDGKEESGACYEDYEGTWEKTKEKYYDEQGYEKDEDEITGSESYVADKLDLYNAKDLMYSQKSFLGGVDIPQEIQDMLNNESFDEKVTGRGYISAENELDDDKIRELKEKQQQREQNHNKSQQQKQEWD